MSVNYVDKLYPGPHPTGSVSNLSFVMGHPQPNSTPNEVNRVISALLIEVRAIITRLIN